jgi:hypothetical protein
MEKSQVFELELSLIQDESIREFTKTMLEQLPNYFYEVAASSTGRYHPAYALGEGGLRRHTQAAVRIAQELFRCEACTGQFTDQQKDMILAALILHDGCKSGIEKQQYTITEHPLEVVKFCEQQNNDIKKIIDREIFNTIMELIKTHMGFWDYDYKTKKVVLPRPKTAMQRFVHMCDYLASRKCLEFNFDAPLSK